MLSTEEQVLKTTGISQDKSAIDQLTALFFAAFTAHEGKVDLNGIYQLFISRGILIKNCGPVPEIYSLKEFIEPREVLLNSGVLTDFKEEELFERTDVFGNVAQRFLLYRKTGILSGEAFNTKGMKTLQFIKTPSGWKISSLAWDDEREGLTLPEEYLE